jgi:hypothetical protein
VFLVGKQGMAFPGEAGTQRGRVGTVEGLAGVQVCVDAGDGAGDVVGCGERALQEHCGQAVDRVGVAPFAQDLVEDAVCVGDERLRCHRPGIGAQR